LLLKFWSLDLDDFNEKLVLKTLRCDSKVEQGDLDADFGQVMRIRQLCRHEEQEVIVIVDLRSSQVDHGLVALLEDILLEDGLEGWIQDLTDVLEQDGEAHLDGSLNRQQELALGKLNDLQTVVLLFLLDPLVALCLRVNDKWPATIRVGRDDTIVD